MCVPGLKIGKEMLAAFEMRKKNQQLCTFRECLLILIIPAVSPELEIRS